MMPTLLLARRGLLAHPLRNALAALRAAPAVALAAPSLTVDAQAENVPLRLRGVEPASYAELHGNELPDLAPLAGERAILVPAVLAVTQGWQAGDKLTLTASGRSVTVTIGGRLAGRAGLQHSGPPDSPGPCGRHCAPRGRLCNR